MRSVATAPLPMPMVLSTDAPIAGRPRRRWKERNPANTAVRPTVLMTKRPPVAPGMRGATAKTIAAVPNSTDRNAAPSAWFLGGRGSDKRDEVRARGGVAGSQSRGPGCVIIAQLRIGLYSFLSSVSALGRAPVRAG